MYKKNKTRTLSVIIAVLILGTLYLAGRKEKLPEERVILSDGTETAESAGDTSLQTSESAQFCVFITGCVRAPGVYIVPEGTRIYEVLELAGGFTEDAAVSAVNLAQPVRDGEAVLIPSLEEGGSGIPAAGLSDGLVDLNAAGKEELMTLPGIGEAKAEAILSYRDTHGRFTSAEELMEVSGIGESTFSRLRDKIKV